MPLKKQNSAAEHWYGTFSSPKISESITSAEPWTDLYAPQDLRDVAIHHDKLREVKEACMKLRARPSCIVVITGPPGCSKSTCLQMVCRSLGFSPPIFWDESDDMDSGLSDPEKFEEFLFRSTRYSSSSESLKLDFRHTAVTTNSRPPQLVIVENLPSWVCDKPTRFHTILRTALSRVIIPTLLAFVLIKSPSNGISGSSNICSLDNAALGRLFPPSIVQELGLCRIEFNPIAPTIMTRAINRIVNIVSENTKMPVPSKSYIQLLAASSSGDIRLAMNNLQFALVSANGKFSTMEHSVFEKDTGLAVFHALGKILHSKRLSGSATDGNSFLPSRLQAYKRAPLSFNPESVLDQSGLSGDDVVAWLHENYLSFHTNSDSDAFDALALISTRISWADAHLSGGMNWRLGLTPAADRNSGICMAGSHYAAMVAARSISFQSPKHAKGASNRFRPLKAPQSKSVESQRRDSWDSLRNSLIDASGPRFREVMVAGLRSSLLDRLPLELKILGPWYPGDAQFLSSLCCFKINSSGDGSYRKTKRRMEPTADEPLQTTRRYQLCDDAAADDIDAEVEIDEEFSDEEMR
ncbi:hypothetical protein Aperf_G00000005847 [Anoplocephala perfoliata]